MSAEVHRWNDTLATTVEATPLEFAAHHVA